MTPFVSDIHNVYPFSLLAWLEAYGLYWSFQRTTFGFIDFFFSFDFLFSISLISALILIVFFFLLLTWDLLGYSFASFLKEKIKQLILGLSFLICVFRTVNSSLSTAFIIHHNFDKLCFHLVQNIISLEISSLTLVLFISVLFNLYMFWIFHLFLCYWFLV